MNYLFGDSVKAATQDPVETIDKLTNRIQTSTLLSDRRTSVQAIKALTRQYKLQVGTKTMSALLNILNTDRMDTDIIKHTLETLLILCTSDKKTEEDKPTGESQSPQDLGVMFTEIYIKSPDNVTLLLEILEEPDFYVRYNTLHLLAELYENLGERLEDCILTSPMGISRLIDLLDDRREIIRNETLLLLLSLTQSNAEIQKIAAFESVFERLLVIIIDETLDGGIVIQDCLGLVCNLLRYNTSNQNLFRESGLIARVAGLCNSLDGKWDVQKECNVSLVLEVFRILCGGGSVNQNSIHQTQILPTLLTLSISPSIPPSVRTQASFTIGDICRGNRVIQNQLVNATIVDGKCLMPRTGSHSRGGSGQQQVEVEGESAIGKILEAVLSKGEFKGRSGGVWVVQCILFENPDTQLQLASTFSQHESIGGVLIKAFLDWDATSSRKDPWRSWFSGTLLSHIVMNNPKTKDLALSVSFDNNTLPLLHKCLYQTLVSIRDSSTGTGADIRSHIASLCFGCTLLYAFPEGVKEFFEESCNLQFLVEQIIQSTGVDPMIQGLSAFLLCICFVYNTHPDTAFSRDSLQALIISRIGKDVLVGRLERFKECNAVKGSHLYFQPFDTAEKGGHVNVFFDYEFVEFFKSSCDLLIKSVFTIKKKPITPTSPVKSELSLDNPPRTTSPSKTQSDEIALLTKKNEILAAKLIEMQQEHEKEMQALQKQYKDLEGEQEDLLVCLADMDMEVATLKKKLVGYGEVFEESDEEDE